MSRITKRSLLSAAATVVAGLIPWRLLHIWSQLELINEKERAQEPINPLRDAADRRLFPFGSHR